MFGQIYFRVLGIGCFLSMALLSSAQSKLDSLHHLNEVVVTARINIAGNGIVHRLRGASEIQI